MKKKRWRNPVKDVPPRPETLAIEGDFGKFTEDMKRLLGPQKEKRKPTSASSSPGLHSGSTLAISSLSMNLHLANGTLQTDNVVLAMPAFGSATGSGTIGAGGALNYHLLLQVAALNGGGVGVAGTGGIAGQLMGMIGARSASMRKNGIPLAVGGTTSNPTFTPPNLSGMVGGARRDAQSLGGKGNSSRAT